MGPDAKRLDTKTPTIGTKDAVMYYGALWDACEMPIIPWLSWAEMGSHLTQKHHFISTNAVCLWTYIEQTKSYNKKIEVFLKTKHMTFVHVGSFSC